MSQGGILGFWKMVEETFQIETDRPYDRVNRHVRLLVSKRNAEKEEIRQRGKLLHSRVSPECRQLLDEWIAKSSTIRDVSPNPPIRNEDQRETSLEIEDEQMDSDGLATPQEESESASDAWPLASGESKHCEDSQIRTSEGSSDTCCKSPAGSMACWSLSGSSVTSDNSVDSESEDEERDEDGMKS